MTVGQVMEISKLEMDDLGPIAQNIEIVSIALNMDPDEIREWPALKLHKHSSGIAEEISKDTVTLEDVDLSGEKLYFKPYDQLTLGEYIDIETYLSTGMISHILSVLYRRRTGGGLDKYEFEPYSNVSVDFRANLFNELEWDGLSAPVLELRKFRDGLIETYKSIFEGDDSEEMYEDDMTDDELEKEKAKKLHEQFAWESFILFLANDDVTKWDEITNLPVYLAFNIASYRKSTMRT